MRDVLSDLKKIKRAEEEQATQALAGKLGMGYVMLDTLPIQPETLLIIPEADAKRLRVICFKRVGKKISVAVWNPKDAETAQYLASLQGGKRLEVEQYLTSRSGIEAILPRYAQVLGEKFLATQTLALSTAEIARASALQPDAVRAAVEKQQGENPLFLLETFLGVAVSARASDIHFEQGSDPVVKVRLRVDGMLMELAGLKPEAYQALRNKMKLIAQMALTFKDTPQEGSFSFAAQDADVNVRVSILPGLGGENIVLRLLDPRLISIPLEALGFRADDLTVIQGEIAKPNGMILNTGPTGSGKTTTLYAILMKKKTAGIKIITIEDPVEYRITDIEQTQVNPKTNYTFAEGLRLILRQDPDVVLVGEIRDEPTADTAVNAALTGHLVLSTLHTNDAFGAVPRLLNLKVKPELLKPSLNLIIAQRLVRKVCSACAAPRAQDPELARKIGERLSQLPERARANVPVEYALKTAKGCTACFSTGYQGRIAVVELLPVREYAERLTGDITENLIAETKTKGFVTMTDDALIKIVEGTTTLEEAERVLGPLL